MGEQEQFQQPDPLQKMYGVLSQKGYYTKSFDEFKQKYSQPENIDKLYSVLNRDGLYTKNKDSFYGKYFPTLPAKPSGEPKPQEVSAPTPQIAQVAPTPPAAPEQPEENPIDLAKQANELSNKTKVAQDRMGATMAFPDDEAIAQSKQVKDKVKALGFDAKELYNEHRDIPERVYQLPGFSKQELLKERTENPESYHRKLAAATWQANLNDALAANLKSGELTPEKYEDIKLNLQSHVQHSGSYEGRRRSTRDILQYIDQNVKDEGLKKRMIDAVGMDRSYTYGTDDKTVNEAISKDPRKTFLDDNQIRGLQYLEDVQPEVARGYSNILIDKKKIENNPAALAGWEERSKRLEELGIGLQMQAVTEDIKKLQSMAASGQELAPAQIEKFAELNKKYEELHDANAELNLKYKTPFLNDTDEIARELLGQETGGLAWVGAKAGQATGNMFSGVWEGVSEPFRSDEGSKINQLTILGESNAENRALYLTQKNSVMKGFDLQMSKGLHDLVDPIINDKKLSWEDKYKQIYPILKAHPTDFQRVPKGNELNITPASLFYSVGGLAAQIAPYLAVEAATGGGASAGVTRKLLSSFTAAMATGFHDTYVSAIKEGVANPYSHALRVTAINSAAMAGAGTPSLVRKMIGGSTTAVGELIGKMTDDEIQAVLSKAKGSKLFDAGKALGGAALEGLKGGAKFEAYMGGAKVLNNAISGKETHPEELAKEAMVGILNFGIFGTVAGARAKFDKLSNIQKDAWYKAGESPELFLDAAKQQFKSGVIDRAKFDNIKENIDKAAEIHKKVPFVNNNGKPLSPEARTELMFLKMQENEIKNNSKSDAPPALKEKQKQQLEDLQVQMNKIYRGTYKENKVEAPKEEIQKPTQDVTTDQPTGIPTAEAGNKEIEPTGVGETNTGLQVDNGRSGETVGAEVKLEPPTVKKENNTPSGIEEVKPSEVIPDKVQEEGESNFPKPSKPIEQLTSGELYDYAKTVKDYNKNLEKEFFGEEGAKKYREAQAISNSSFASREKQKEADKIVDEFHAKLTTQQENEFFGMNAPEGIIYDHSEINNLASKVSLIEQAENVNDIARSLKLPLLSLSRDKNSVETKVILEAAKRKAAELGIPPEELVKESIKNIAKDLKDENDAEFLADEVLKALITEPTQTVNESNLLPNSEPTPEPSVATGDAQSGKVDNQIKTPHSDFREEILRSLENEKGSEFDFVLDELPLQQSGRKTAVKNIRQGKSTKATRMVEEAIQKMYDEGYVYLNRGRGNHVERIAIPLEKYMEEIKRPLEATEADLHELNTLLGDEAFNDTFDRAYNEITKTENNETKRNGEVAETTITPEGAAKPSPIETKAGKSSTQPDTENTIGSGEGGQPPTTEEQAEAIGGGEGQGIRHADTAETRKEFGLPDYEKKTDTIEAWDAEADQRIANGEMGSVIEKMQKGEQPSAVETRMMGKYIATLADKADKSPTKENLVALRDAIELSDRVGGSDVGKALRARQGDFLPDDSLSGNLVKRMEAAGVAELTEAQKKEVETLTNELKRTKEEASQKLDELEQKNKELQAELEIANAKKAAKKNEKKDYKKERSDIKQSIKDKWKKAANDGTLTAVPVPYAKQLASIAPDVAKLMKSYVEEGVTTLVELVDRIHGDVKEAIPEIDRKDVFDILAGKYNEPKKTKNELMEQMRDLRDEAKYIDQLETLNMGMEPKTERGKIERNKKIKELQDKIKEHDVTKLSQIKKRNEAQLKELQEKLAKGDFTKKKSTSAIDNLELQKKYPELYKETLNAIRARENAKHQLDLANLNEEIAAQSKGKKRAAHLARAFRTAKALKAGIDDSGLGVQTLLLGLANPRAFASALKEHALDALSAERFERNLAKLHNSEWWPLIEQSGLSVVDPKSLRESEKNDIYNDTYWDRMQVKLKNGKTINLAPTKPFERAFTSLGNNLRVNVFLRRAEYLMDKKGITINNHPEEYKALASVVNNLSGRGTMMKGIETHNDILSAVLWSPRLLASSINVLGVSDLGLMPLGEKGFYRSLTSSQKRYVAGQLVKGIGTGVALMALLSYGLGGDSDLDPTSVTFGTVKVGEYRYTIFGRYNSVVRMIAMSAMATRKTSKGADDLTDKKGSTLNDEGGKFIRGKINPTVGILWDIWSRKGYDGKPITMKSELKNALLPMSIDDVLKGLSQDGTKSLLIRGIPSFVGVKVSNEQDFQQGGGGAAPKHKPSKPTPKHKARE